MTRSPGAWPPPGCRARRSPRTARPRRWCGGSVPTRPTRYRTCARSSRPGRVLVCSDGVFRYRPEAAELAELMPDKPPLDTARDLVAFALDQGGHDNITAVVLTYPPGAEEDIKT